MEGDTSDLHVHYLLGRCYHWGLGCTRDKVQAAVCYERAGNHIMALYCLAELLNQQDRPIAERQRAVALYRQAATQGCADAQFSLGEIYEEAIPGVLERDVEQAKHWYSLAFGNATSTLGQDWND
eukprot:TRINITY_DN5221_c0_g1_i1.p1 TRINITY_DN5221_c0_g1~~TRINITY_DN5221_c0_g1_i1.p1  ORF type:complete len:134 (+),score=17.54 TRINITY_DN5221_c0_g1_i1:29-403(+)